MHKHQFNCWDDFRKFVDRERTPHRTYWRGQGDVSWPLASSLERNMMMLSQAQSSTQCAPSQPTPTYSQKRREGWEGGQYSSVRDQYLETFKKAARGLRGPNPRELTTEEWWALGRHYGLITPLLDWTEKPYIAAFFAFTELFEQVLMYAGDMQVDTRSIVIYRLVHSGKLEGDGLRVVTVDIDELPRLHSQRALFTWLDSEEHFELQAFLDATGRGELLTQIVLQGPAIREGLRDLESHGIDFRLLYPDLHGAALYANTRWELLERLGAAKK